MSLLTNSPNTPHLLASFQSPFALHLILDYIPNGTLWDLLSSLPPPPTPSSPPPGLAEDDVRYWSLGIVDALGWMHNHGWAHRDVKPQNLLIDGRGGGSRPRVLLTDFGSAAKVFREGGNKLARKDCLWPVGTPDYIAPEVLEASEEAMVRAEEEDEDVNEGTAADVEGSYGVDVDWWALGVII